MNQSKKPHQQPSSQSSASEDLSRSPQEFAKMEPFQPTATVVTPNYGEAGYDGVGENLAGVKPEFLNLFEHDPSEKITYQATRHPIGVSIIYAVTALALMGIVLAFIFFISDSSILASIGLSGGGVIAVASVVTFIVLLMVGTVGYVYAMVYQKSRFILTNQKVVFIHYHSLVSRQVSQLNIANVEDVNVSQPHLLDRIFKMGKVTIETAGEQNNHVLSQVSEPYEFARRTIQAHESSIAEYGN